MRSRLVILTILSVFAGFISSPAHLHGQKAAQAAQTQSEDHEQHHPDAAAAPSATMPTGDMAGMMARMKANDQKLDALVKKMNDAKGTAKTEAVAELLTALVEDRRNGCEPMMMNMMSMMNMMGGGSGHNDKAPATPK